METTKILLAEDDPNLGMLLSQFIRAKGYQCTLCNDGEAAYTAFNSGSYDFVILDVMMPNMDGIEACQIIRNDLHIEQPIIAFLTSRAEDYSQIAGFDAGADDYISKPVKPRVLVSRIKAMLRRTASQRAQQEDVQGIFIDRERYVVKVEGEELNLPKKEFELLSLLTSQPGKVYTREIILSSVWGDEVVVGDRTIDVHIRKLREKIGDDYIKTIKGVGYKFGK